MKCQMHLSRPRLTVLVAEQHSLNHPCTARRELKAASVPLISARSSSSTRAGSSIRSLPVRRFAYIVSYAYATDHVDFWRAAIRCIGGENACPPEDAGGPPGSSAARRLWAEQGKQVGAVFLVKLPFKQD
jgi:hypothetical protein